MMSDINNWNPMKEDYYNENFNSYDTGLGAKMPSYQQPANVERRTTSYSSGVKLYIHPIPTTIDKDALRNIFSNFGAVNDVYIDDKRFGFAYMKDMEGAQKAIRELNDNSQYSFKVSFATEKAKVPVNEANSENYPNKPTMLKNSVVPVRPGSYFYPNDGNLMNNLNNGPASQMMSTEQVSRSQHLTMLPNLPQQMPHYPSLPFVPAPTRNCLGCSNSTPHYCLECKEPFCTISCYIRGYTHHTRPCITISGHSSLINQKPNPFNSHFKIANNMCGPTPMLPNTVSANVNENITYTHIKPEYGPYTDNRNFKQDAQEYRDSMLQTKPRNSLSKMANSVDKADERNRPPPTYETESTRSNNRQSYHTNNNVTERRDEMNGGANRIRGDHRTSYESNERRRAHRANYEDASSIEDDSAVGDKYKSRSSQNRGRKNDDDNDRIVRGERKNENGYKSGDCGNETGNWSRSQRSNDDTRARSQRSNDDTRGTNSRGRVADQRRKSSDDDLAGSKYDKSYTYEMDDKNIGFANRRNNGGKPKQSSNTSHYDPTPTYLAKENRKCFEIGKPIEYKDTWRVEIRKQQRFEQNDERTEKYDSSFERNANRSMANSNRGSAANSTKSEVQVSLPDLTFELEIGAQITVLVTFIPLDQDEPIFYVTDPRKNETLSNMLNEIHPENRPNVEVFGGCMCASKFDDGRWYRAKVNTVEPIRINYVDFGNSSSVERADELKSLPEPFCRIPHLAIPVKLAKGRLSDFNVTENNNITIVPIGKSSPQSKTWIVNIPNNKEETATVTMTTSTPEPTTSMSKATTPKSTAPTPTSTTPTPREMTPTSTSPAPAPRKLPSTFIDELPETSSVSQRVPIEDVRTVQIQYQVSSREYFVMNTEDENLIIKIIYYPEEKYLEKPVQVPIVGLRCISQYEGVWCRSIIIDTSPLRISYLDFGNVAEVNLNELFVEPTELSSIKNLAYKVTFDKDFDYEVNSSQKITIRKKPNANVWQFETDKPAAAEETNVTMSPSDVNNLGNRNIRIQVLTEIEKGLEYGVLPTEHETTFRHIQQKLLDGKSSLLKLTKIYINDSCVVIDRNNVCFRGIISNTDPLTVYLIDFGCEEEFDSTSLYKMPVDLANIPPLGFRIALDDESAEFSEGNVYVVELVSKLDEAFYAAQVATTCESGYVSGLDTSTPVDSTSNLPKVTEESSHRDDIGSVKPLPGGKAATIVERMAQNDLSHKNLPTQPGSVTDLLSSPCQGRIFVSKYVTDTLYAGFVLPARDPLIKGSTKMMNKLQPDASYRPEIGELVAVSMESMGTWIRGQILGTSTRNQLNPCYQIALVDLATVENCDSIAKLPEQLKELPSHAAYLRLESTPEYPLESSKYYGFSSQSQNGIVTATLKDTDDVYVAEIKPWTPTVDQLSIRGENFTNGCLVKITSLIASNKCAITLTDDTSAENRIDLFDALNIYYNENATERPTRELLPDEIYAVEHDSCYWRAKIMGKKMRDEKCVTVQLLDRGDEIVVKKDEIKSLPEKFKLPFNLATVVELKGVRKTEINKKERNFVEFLITEEKEFELVIEGRSEVTLKILRSEDYVEDDCFDNYEEKVTNYDTLNEALNYLLVPDWKLRNNLEKESPLGDDAYSREPIYLQNLVHDEFEVGSKLTLYIGAVYDDQIAVIHKEGDYYRHMIETNLSARLDEYATENTESYVPFDTEICLAKYDGKWHRGCCFINAAGKKLTVQLIDDGKFASLWQYDIRILPKEFTVYPLVIVLCRIKDFDRYDKTDIANLIGTEVRGCRILEKMGPEHDYEYVIELPSSIR